MPPAGRYCRALPRGCTACAARWCAVVFDRVVHERLRIVAPGVVDRVADLVGADGVVFVECLLRLDDVGIALHVRLAHALFHGGAPGVLHGLFQVGLVLAAVVDLVIDHHVLAVHARIHAVPIERDPVDGELIDRVGAVIALIHEDIIGKEKIVRRQLHAVGTEKALLETNRNGYRSVRPRRAGDLGRGAVAPPRRAERAVSFRRRPCRRPSRQRTG